MKVVYLRLRVGIWACCMQITCTHVPACVCVHLGVCACTCSCVCALGRARMYRFTPSSEETSELLHISSLYLLCDQFANVHLTHLTQISRLLIRSHSCVLCWADRLLHTYNSSTLHSGFPSSPSSFFSYSLTCSALFPSHTAVLYRSPPAAAFMF